MLDIVEASETQSEIRVAAARIPTFEPTPGGAAKSDAAMNRKGWARTLPEACELARARLRRRIEKARAQITECEQNLLRVDEIEIEEKLTPGATPGNLTAVLPGDPK